MSGDSGSGTSPAPTVSRKFVTLDDVLVNEIGQFGWFQVRNICLVALPIILSALKTDYIFTAAAIPHRCQIPECGEDGKLHELEPEWIFNAIPKTSSGLSSCERYPPLRFGINGSLDHCPASLFDQSETVACDGYVFARNNTVVYDFDLGCQDWLRALAGTLTNLGILLGLPITGYLSDRFGRRLALILSVFNLGLVGLIRAFSVNYTMFMILQFLQTFLGAGIYSSSFIFAAELVGPKYRVLTSAMTISMFSVGQMLLGAFAWLIHYWRNMNIILYIPCLFIVGYFWILSESIRWLLSKGKYVEAKNILETLARVNKAKISEESLEALINPPIHVNNDKEIKPPLIRRVLRSPILLKRVCVTPFWWATGTLVYYGLSINSTTLSDTMYLNYILVAAIEIPGFFSVILLLDRFGRKYTLSLSYFFCAACNIIFILIPSSFSTFRLVIYLLGKFCSSIIMSAMYLYTSELYPTEFRHSLLAFSSMVGRIASTIAPLTPVLMKYWHGIPSTIFAVMGILSGVLVLTQPETLGTKMPDTLPEAEALGQPKADKTTSCTS